MDADEVSVTSLAEDEPAEDAVYEVEEILAEKFDTWDHDHDQPVFRGVKYLTKWDGYPLHECTWEPKEAFSVPDQDGSDLPGTPPILQTWYELKKSMGETQFRSYCQENIESFYAAVESAERAKADREAKRAEERQKRARPVLLDSDEEDESTTSDKLQRRTTLEYSASHEKATDTRNSSSGKQPLAVSKPPLEQSASPASVEGELPDPPRVESGRPSKKTAESLVGAKDSASGSQSRCNSIQTPRNPPQSATTTVTPKPIAKNIRFKMVTVPSKAPQASSQSLKDTVSQRGKAVPTAPVTDGNKKLDKSVAFTSTVTQRKAASVPEVTKAVTAGPSSAPKARPATLAGPASVKEANQSVGIRVVNQPKVQKRSEWTYGNRLYNTLHFRAVAQKRSRTEGAPDPAALEIVNDVPGAIKSNTPTTHDNPYARREAGRGRPERSPVDDDRSRGPISGSPYNERMPLASWEVDKIPQVCASWRLSNNCSKTAQTCPFMHRNKDPNGLDYPVGDTNGRIPPKYHKPPLTCVHWLYNQRGCYKQDDQCLFAHKNTGWIQTEKKHSGDDGIAQIDPRILPQHERADGSITQVPVGPKNQTKLAHRNLTCWYWAYDQCRNTAETCPFQHYYTGVVARAPPGRENVPAETPVRRDSATTTIISKESSTLSTNDIDDLEETNIVEPIPEPTPALAPPPPLAAELPPAKATCENVRKQISSACELNFGEIFASNDSKSANGLMDRRAFLVYHSEEHAEELELITRWLLMHHVQISGVHYAGGWEEFERQIKSGGSGVIIIHPDFEYFTQLPGLGEILCHSIRVWSVGLQEGLEYDPALSEAPPTYRYDAIEILPVGGFIYITDEVFEQEPQLALRIVQNFFDKIAKLKQRIGPPCPGREVPDASLLWRLCVRPELMEYLIQDCEQHEAALEAGDADVQSRAQLYVLLAETNYIEQDVGTEPLSAVFDKYPILSERRIMAESEPMWYFSTRARSRSAANLNMVRYYAGLQVALRRDYRHFFVVHPQPQAGYVQQWRQEIQTIAEVLTPRQCLEELTKESECSMFDFCERFMRKREKERGEGEGEERGAECLID